MKSIAVLTLLFPPLIGFSCSCMPSGISKSFDYASVIFYGKYLESDSSFNFYDSMGYPYKIENFEVKKMYKNTNHNGLEYFKEFEDKQLISILSTCDKACGMCFERNKNYLVYCYQDISGYIMTDGCTRTRQIVNNNFISTLPFDQDVNQDENKQLSKLVRNDTATTNIPEIVQKRNEELLDLRNENGELKEKLKQRNQMIKYLLILIGGAIVLSLIKASPIWRILSEKKDKW